MPLHASIVGLKALRVVTVRSSALRQDGLNGMPSIRVAPATASTCPEERGARCSLLHPVAHTATVTRR